VTKVLCVVGFSGTLYGVVYACFLWLYLLLSAVLYFLPRLGCKALGKLLLKPMTACFPINPGRKSNLYSPSIDSFNNTGR